MMEEKRPDHLVTSLEALNPRPKHALYYAFQAALWR